MLKCYKWRFFKYKSVVNRFSDGMNVWILIENTTTRDRKVPLEEQVVGQC